MRRRDLVAGCVAVAVSPAIHPAVAQTPALKRIGIVLQGGPYYLAGVEGLREGLKAAGLEEGRDVALFVRDAMGDLDIAGRAARDLERDGVDVIVALATSVALASKRGTQGVPIVFAAGSDPVAMGLVDSIARPGGRVTGLHSIVTDLTPKRVEILHELVPAVKRVLTFYDPRNQAAAAAALLARDAARGFGMVLVESHVNTTEQLAERVQALEAKDADAFFFVSDAMVLSRDELLVEKTNALRMPTMATYVDPVAKGALAGYGVSYRDLGRRAAVYVRRILSGSSPSDLPVEAIERPTLAINLRTAKALGLEISPALLNRADEVIE
jgi:putative tryptophan/tyrosine transport system substrate-binding protein